MALSGSAAPSGSLIDVRGLRVGQTQRVGRGWCTGTTVVLADAGAVAGCDVRGGGPGTRETDLLRPEAMIERVHGICLSGGSAYGLAAADGVMAHLAEQHIGFAVGPEREQVVPIVPAAVIFDLGRAGRFANRPDASFGRRAAQRATARPLQMGAVGAGAGARAGGLQGGVGTASLTFADGTVVAALAVVNAAGNVIDPATALPWWREGLGLRRPPASERRALHAYLDGLAAAGAATARPTVAPRLDGRTSNTGTLASGTLNTTIGVVATSAELTKTECHKLAAVAHDGLARAVRPVHSMFDGDTIFALATGVHPIRVADPADVPEFVLGRRRPLALNGLLVAAAECFAWACTLAIVSARSTGDAPSYRDLCPSAFPAGM